MTDMTDTKPTKKGWAKRQVAFNVTEMTDTMLNDLVEEAKATDPTATQTQVLNRAIAHEYQRVFKK